MIILSPFNALLPDPAYAAAAVFTGTGKVLLKGENGIEYLEDLLVKGDYKKDQPAALYIYQVEAEGRTQTGIWAQVGTNDIKVHEQVLPEKVHRINSFRNHSGLEAKPVLLIYRPKTKIRELINMITTTPADNTYHDEQKIHRVWKVHNEKFISALKTLFANVDSVYMADGHHRLAANPFPTLSALLMDADEVSVKPYHRLIQTDKDLGKYFYISASNEPVLPNKQGHFGLLKNDKWYHLIAKIPKDNDTETLAAIFNYIEYTPEVKSEPGKFLFTLAPLHVNEVLKAADEGIILPPKSTWIEPKIPYGLLMNRHNVSA